MDSALIALLRTPLTDSVDIRLNPPPDNGPALSLHLHTIAEDLNHRLATWTDTRDDRGRVVGRQPPARRYQFGYLVAAWCADPGAEHALLDTVLTTLAETPTIPTHHLPESLRTPTPILVDVANPRLPQAPPDLRLDIGGLRRPTLDVVLTATWTAKMDTDLPLEPSAVELGVTRGTPGEPERPTPPRPTGRIRE